MRIILIFFVVVLEALVVMCAWQAFYRARAAAFEAGIANIKADALKVQVNECRKSQKNIGSDIQILRTRVETSTAASLELENRVYEYTGKIEALKLEIEELKKPIIVMPIPQPKKGRR